MIDLKKDFSRSPEILVIDDDWLNRDLLQAYISSAGGKVRAFSDANQAWKAILNGLRPDLIFTDYQMPGMDGNAFCRLVKSFEPTRFTPVVIVTAIDSEEEKLHAIDAGADEFIAKPYNATVLLTRARSLLRIQQLHTEVENRNALLRQVLNRYMDEEVTNIILTDPERHLKLGGEACQVTVLFADLRGFTPFTEANPAHKVVETLNFIFDRLTGVVFEYGGTFDKYLGDAIMAFFGAPVPRPGDAERAVQAALEMQRRFTTLQQAQPDMLSALPGLGIGLHYGEAIVGNIGAEKAMDYTVIGDTVNIARRLQEIALPGEILLTEALAAQVGARQSGNAFLIHSRLLQPSSRLLPGRSEPVRVYSIN